MNDEKPPRLLIIDDEKAICDVLTASLNDDGYSVSSARDGLSGLKAIREIVPHIVLLDIWMPGEMDGLEVLRQVKELIPATQVIIMSGHGTIETAVKAVKLGAWDFVEKPLSMDRISILIKNILNFQNEQREKILLLNKLRKNLALVGTTEEMKELKSLVAAAAQQEHPLLIVGEAGAGKTLLAHNVHYLGPRAGRNLVELQCGMIPKELQMQDLFGSEKSSRKGKLEFARQGTLFLDEIGELSNEVQMRLLEYLRTGRIRREDSDKQTPVDARIVAASEIDLVERVRSGQFSEELYAHLATLRLRVPALRDRLADVPALLTHFGEQFVREGGYKIKSFSASALAALQSYPWPGNIREIRNFVERLYILIPDEQIDLDDLRFAGLVEKTDGEQGQHILTFREARAEFEKEFLLKKITENQGNISRTAEVIGLERSYLHRKIKAYGIEV